MSLIRTQAELDSWIGSLIQEAQEINERYPEESATRKHHLERVAKDREALAKTQRLTTAFLEANERAANLTRGQLQQVVASMLELAATGLATQVYLASDGHPAWAVGNNAEILSQFCELVKE